MVSRRRFQQPPVCVVTGTYNRLALLKAAVTSAREAAGKIGCDFVVVDGGSTDGTLEWLAKQSDISTIRQKGPLTGAVKAFNLGFRHAVEHEYPFVVHYNDDAEIVDGTFEQALAIMDSDPRIGEIAFEMDLRGWWSFEYINGKVYGNFGMVRTAAGMEVARKQGDPTGCAWWNPIYRTYGADCEFGCNLWSLGWTVHEGHGIRVHDSEYKDALRVLNNEQNQKHNRPDSDLFWSRWADWRGPE